MAKEPLGELARYAFGYSDKKPGATWWIIHVAMVLFVLFSIFTPKPAPAYTIDGDGGGVVEEYAQKYNELARTGQSIKVDGPCYSSCTMLFGYFPRSRVCITKYAEFGFHYSFWWPFFYSKSGTTMLTKGYPPVVLNWLKARGGLSLSIKKMPGSALKGYFPLCK